MTLQLDTERARLAELRRVSVRAAPCVSRRLSSTNGASRAGEAQSAARQTRDQPPWSGFSSNVRAFAEAPPRDDGDASDDASRFKRSRMMLCLLMRR